MEIQMIQEDIDKGRPQHSALCPTARAIRRITKQANIAVLKSDNLGVIYIEGLRYAMPDNVHAFIDRFDQGLTVAPIWFELVREQ